MLGPLRRPIRCSTSRWTKGWPCCAPLTPRTRTLTLAELATLTGMTRGSAQRTVHTLHQLGPGLAEQATDDPVHTMLAQSTRADRKPATLTAADAIFEWVATWRQVGCASNCEELFLGDMGIAAPIRGSKGQALGAVHLSPPTSRWTMDETQKKLSPMVIECVRAM